MTRRRVRDGRHRPPGAAAARRGRRGHRRRRQPCALAHRRRGRRRRRRRAGPGGGARGCPPAARGPEVRPGRQRDRGRSSIRSCPAISARHLGNFLAHFPGFADQSILDQKIDEVLERLVSEGSDGSVDYATRVEAAPRRPDGLSVSQGRHRRRRERRIAGTGFLARRDHGRRWHLRLGVRFLDGRSRAYRDVEIRIADRARSPARSTTELPARRGRRGGPRRPGRPPRRPGHRRQLDLCSRPRQARGRSARLGLRRQEPRLEATRP